MSDYGSVDVFQAWSLTQGVVPQTTGQHLCIKYVFVESLLALTTNDVHACLWSLRE